MPLLVSRINWPLCWGCKEFGTFLVTLELMFIERETWAAIICYGFVCFGLFHRYRLFTVRRSRHGTVVSNNRRCLWMLSHVSTNAVWLNTIHGAPLSYAASKRIHFSPSAIHGMVSSFEVTMDVYGRFHTYRPMPYRVGAVHGLRCHNGRFFARRIRKIYIYTAVHVSTFQMFDKYGVTIAKVNIFCVLSRVLHFLE